MAKEKSKTMMVLAVGCGVLLLLVGLAIVGGVFFVKNQVDEIQADLKDPSTKTLEILGAEQLPPGYYPQFAFDIFKQVRISIISNVPKTGEDPEMGEDGMMYFSIPFLKVDQEARGFFDGTNNDTRVLRDNGINIDVDEVVARGVLNLKGQEMPYVVSRGRVQTDNGNVDGLNAVVLIECDGKSRTSFALRYQEDPDPNAPAEELDLSGTPCSPENLAAFFDHFDFCK